jgi:DNA-binding transcriptional regulator LsrR (DeoR family)
MGMVIASASDSFVSFDVESVDAISVAEEAEEAESLRGLLPAGRCCSTLSTDAVIARMLCV